jgi:hypothetical protein
MANVKKNKTKLESAIVENGQLVKLFQSYC